MDGDEFRNRVVGIEIGDGRADGDFEIGDVYGECGLLLIDLLSVSIGVFHIIIRTHEYLEGRVKRIDALWSDLPLQRASEDWSSKTASHPQAASCSAFHSKHSR